MLQSNFSWRNIIVRRIVFSESPMFDRNDMVNASLKARQMKRGGNRSIQEEADWQCLDMSMAWPAVFSVLPQSNLYQVHCLERPATQADLFFSSMTGTSSVTASRRPFGSYAKGQRCTLLLGQIYYFTPYRGCLFFGG